jgi:hypothetical protein
MSEKCCKWTYKIPTFSIPRPSKIYPDWDFLNENLATLIWSLWWNDMNASKNG